MVAVDVMGGDFAPGAILGGALCAARSGTSVGLFGPQDLIVQYLNKNDENWSSLPISIFNSTQIIAMGEEPVKAISQKKQSSLVLAVEAVKDKRCCAVVSAGNSGALMVAATFILGRKKGIERPAIAGFLSSMKGSALCLDLGANADCKPSYLEQFAHLGCEYLIKNHNIKNPKVGLLSNGSEPSKGSKLIKDTYDLLLKSKLNFIGNLEPKNVFLYKADVIVCDGFSGNILLKAFECSTSIFKKWFKDDLDEVNFFSKIIIAKWGRRFLTKVFKKSDWAQKGGALLLGVNGSVVVCHGCSNALAIENAIKFAQKTSNKEDNVFVENNKISNQLDSQI
jgi:phosphate acyltransferase